MAQGNYSDAYVEAILEKNEELKARVIELEKKLKLAELDMRIVGGSLVKRSR